MARISKHSVEYEAQGKVWLATFIHAHARTHFTHTKELKHLLLGVAKATEHGDPFTALYRLRQATKLLGERFFREQPIETTIHGRKSSVQHTTTCLLGHGNEIGAILKGEAYCSLSDHYNWRFGLKAALTAALERLSIYPKQVRVKTFNEDAEWTGKYHMEAEPRCIDGGVAFTVHITAFIREMRIKTYPFVPPTGNSAPKQLSLPPTPIHVVAPTTIMAPIDGWVDDGGRSFGSPLNEWQDRKHNEGYGAVRD